MANPMPREPLSSRDKSAVQLSTEEMDVVRRRLAGQAVVDIARELAISEDQCRELESSAMLRLAGPAGPKQ